MLKHIVKGLKNHQKGQITQLMDIASKCKNSRSLIEVFGLCKEMTLITSKGNN